MLTYALRRLLGLVPVVFLVTLIVFTLNHHIPGDPGRIRLGQRAEPAQVEEYNRSRGYLDPFFVQYARYLKNVFLHLDFGESDVKAGASVTEILLGAFRVTMKLAVFGALIAALLGVGAGVVSAVKSRSLLDYASMVLAVVGVSTPVFWLGILLIIFVSHRVGLPATGFDDSTWLSQFRSLVLPALCLGLISSATIARLTRSAMLETLGQDYVRTAHAKGLSASVVVLRHALRNAAIPIVTVVGNSFAYLLVGAVLTESVFALPGLGRTIVESIVQRDRFVVTGGILFMAVVFVLVNLLVDLTYGLFDPRVRLSSGAD